MLVKDSHLKEESMIILEHTLWLTEKCYRTATSLVLLCTLAFSSYTVHVFDFSALILRYKPNYKRISRILFATIIPSIEI